MPVKVRRAVVGRVARVENKALAINQGSVNGVEVGDKFIIIQLGTNIGNNPMRKTNSVEIPVAQGIITSVSPNQAMLGNISPRPSRQKRGNGDIDLQLFNSDRIIVKKV